VTDERNTRHDLHLEQMGDIETGDFVVNFSADAGTLQQKWLLEEARDPDVLEV
jgi:hypothetical protein